MTSANDNRDILAESFCIIEAALRGTSVDSQSTNIEQLFLMKANHSADKSEALANYRRNSDAFDRISRAVGVDPMVVKALDRIAKALRLI